MCALCLSVANKTQPRTAQNEHTVYFHLYTEYRTNNRDKTMKKISFVFAALLASTQTYAAETTPVLNHYADLAHAMYSDSLTTAKSLQKKLHALTNTPNKETLQAARTAWKTARAPYQQTEAYRFGNSIVDDWEGKVNAWPLDEGLIDYVATSYGDESEENPLYTSNVIANRSIKLSGEVIDTNRITTDLLANTLHEVGGIEANVATGYHAI
jgi:putative iron-regulated protein